MFCIVLSVLVSISQYQSVSVSPGQSQSVPVSPGQSRSVPVSPGQYQSVSVSIGQSRSVPVSPGHFWSVWVCLRLLQITIECFRTIRAISGWMGWMDGWDGRLSPSASLLRAPYGANKISLKGSISILERFRTFIADLPSCQVCTLVI